MKGQKAIIELLNGQWERGSLNHPFKTDMNKIDLKLNENGKCKTYAMSDVCCIHMVPESELIPAFRDNSWVLKEIKTVSDNKYFAYIMGRGKSETGFYAYNANSNGQGEHKLIFFNFLGVKAPDSSEINKILQQQERSDTKATAHEKLADDKKKENRNRAEGTSPDHSGDKNYADDDRFLSRQKIGEILIESNLITTEQMESALAAQRSGSRKKLGQILLDKELISEEKLLKTLAIKFQLRFIDLDNVVPSVETLILCLDI